MAEETRVCPTCGKKMIKETDITVLTMSPPMYWWCGCGHWEHAGYAQPPKPLEQMRQERWLAANREGTP